MNWKQFTLTSHTACDHALSASIRYHSSRSAFTVINKAKGKTVVRDNLSEF